jgi:LysW-gamma-L-lysine carboxypeptidase
VTDEEAVEFLRAMLSIESHTGGEAAAVRFLVETFTRLGLDGNVDSAGNAIGHSHGEGRRLMFLGHVDTVPGVIPVRVEGGSIFGRGAVDAKGPLAAAIVAASRNGGGHNLTIVGAVGEEGPSYGARHLATGPSPDALIIGEPGQADSIVLGYKGSMRAHITFTQPSAHSAGASTGACDNAIEAWERVRTTATRMSPNGSGFNSLTPTLLELASANDGMTQRATLHAGFRLPPDLDLDDTRSRIALAVQPGSVEFDHADPAFVAPKNTALVASFLRAIRSEDARPRFKMKTGTSDMNVVGPVWGCQAVAYGPGDSSLDHTPNEHIEIEEYLRGIRVLTRVFEDW